MKSKLKTKSSVKKRIRVTGSGAIKVAQAGNRHGMRKRCNRVLRTSKGMVFVEKCDLGLIRQHLPYSRRKLKEVF